MSADTDTLLRAAEGLIAFAQKYTVENSIRHPRDMDALRALDEWYVGSAAVVS